MSEPEEKDEFAKEVCKSSENVVIASDNNSAIENSGADNTDDSDESDEEEVMPSEPLATTRSRRSTAGNRMSKLIQEEEDEFYTNLYGGFHDEDDDDDFDDEEEADKDGLENDYDVDSDFSIDETDEIAPEHQAVDEEPKKRKAGAYKDPKPRIPVGASSGSFSTPVQPKLKPGVPSTSTPLSPSKLRPERTFRDSTRKKTAETIKNIETGSKRKKKHRNREAPRKLTQEELLEEAKITEEENIKSLEVYQRLESEKLKKSKLAKKTLPVPYVTYYSSVFKKPQSLQDGGDDESTVSMDLDEPDGGAAPAELPKRDKNKYTRNFLTFVGCEPKSVKANKRTLLSRT